MTDITETPFRTILAQRLCQHFATLSDAGVFKGRPSAHSLLSFYAHHAAEADDSTVRVGAAHTDPARVEASTGWYASVIRSANTWLARNRIISIDDDGSVTLLSVDAASEEQRLKLLEDQGAALAPTSLIAGW